MLHLLAGNVHQVYTGVTMIWVDREGKQEEYSFYVCTGVVMYRMNRAEIMEYVCSGEPMDKAGAYAVQGRAAAYIKSYIESARCDLIETAATDIARKLVKERGVDGVSVTVHKPEAPIGFPFGDVSVTSNLVWSDVCLGLGSNMGDKRAHLDYAVDRLNACEHCRDVTVSQYYDTPPYGVTEQDDFLNACVRMYTYLTPRAAAGYVS